MYESIFRISDFIAERCNSYNTVLEKVPVPHGTVGNSTRNLNLCSRDARKSIAVPVQ